MRWTEQFVTCSIGMCRQRFHSKEIFCNSILAKVVRWWLKETTTAWKQKSDQSYFSFSPKIYHKPHGLPLNHSYICRGKYFLWDFRAFWLMINTWQFSQVLSANEVVASDTHTKIGDNLILCLSTDLWLFEWGSYTYSYLNQYFWKVLCNSCFTSNSFVTIF